MRDVGNINVVFPSSSSGNESIIPLPISRYVSDVSLCSPNSKTCSQRFAPNNESFLRLVGKPSSGKDTILGHSSIVKSCRKLRLCMLFGKASSFLQFPISSLLKLVGSKSPKEIRLSHHCIQISLR